MSNTFAGLYASSFWNEPSDAMCLLESQANLGNDTLNKFSIFYKNFSDLELEYSKKLKSLIAKSALNDSIDKQAEGSLKISMLDVVHHFESIVNSHNKKAASLKDLENNLSGKYKELRSKEKELEKKIRESWAKLENTKIKCHRKRSKYAAIWEEISDLKRGMLTLDVRETQLMEAKLIKLKQEMIKLRSDNWELVKEYNYRLSNWQQLWVNSCSHWQVMEEERSRFLKANIWEFANVISTNCVDEDQLAERMRLALQGSSTHKDIKRFVGDYGTGNEMLKEMQFVDYAKGDTDTDADFMKLEAEVKRFSISELPENIDFAKILPDGTNIPKKETDDSLKVSRKSPPQTNEVQDVQFTYVGKAKETFNEIQEQAQLEAQTLSIDHSKTESTSSYKVMSEYSNPTTRTSISSHNTDTFNRGNPLKSYLENLKSSNNSQPHPFTPIDELSSNIFRDSHKRVSSSNRSSRHSSRSIRRSKSQTLPISTINSKGITPDNLPSHSSEGYPVLDYTKAQYSYAAQIPEELSFKKKDVLLVLHRQEDGWWFCEALGSGDSGLAPSNYLISL